MCVQDWKFLQNQHEELKEKSVLEIKMEKDNFKKLEEKYEIQVQKMFFVILKLPSLILY